MSSSSSDTPRPTIRLTLRCDNACLFCCQEGLDDPAEGPSPAEIDAVRTAGHDAVTLVGGEPLLFSGLEDLVADLRGRGFSRIGVQTNGARLGDDEGLAARLAAAGLTDLHLSIHAARPEAHDYHTGREGSFARIERAARRARRAGLDIVVSTVLTRSNQAVLSELPALLSSVGASAWLVQVPLARGRAEVAAPRLLPRLAVALPYALHALSRARSAGISTFVRGAPLCLLGPFARDALPEPARRYAAVCDECAARARCPGVDPLYLERFGGDELRARGDVPAPSHVPIAALFVGPGELAPAGSGGGRSTSLPVIR